MHSPLGNNPPEVTLQFDDAVQPSTKSSTGDEPTAEPLEAKDRATELFEVLGKLASPPGCLETVEATPHL